MDHDLSFLKLQLISNEREIRDHKYSFQPYTGMEEEAKLNNIFMY